MNLLPFLLSDTRLCSLLILMFRFEEGGRSVSCPSERRLWPRWFWNLFLERSFWMAAVSYILSPMGAIVEEEREFSADKTLCSGGFGSWLAVRVSLLPSSPRVMRNSLLYDLIRSSILKIAEISNSPFSKLVVLLPNVPVFKLRVSVVNSDVVSLFSNIAFCLFLNKFSIAPSWLISSSSNCFLRATSLSYESSFSSRSSCTRALYLNSNYAIWRLYWISWGGNSAACCWLFIEWSSSSAYCDSSPLEASSSRAQPALCWFDGVSANWAGLLAFDGYVWNNKYLLNKFDGYPYTPACSSNMLRLLHFLSSYSLYLRSSFSWSSKTISSSSLLVSWNSWLT